MPAGDTHPTHLAPLTPTSATPTPATPTPHAPEAPHALTARVERLPRMRPADRGALALATVEAARALAPTVRRSVAVAVAGLATEYAMRRVVTRALTTGALGSASLAPRAPRRRRRTVATEVITVERRR